MEDNMEVPLKKLKVTIWSSNPLLSIYPEKTLIWKDTCTPMFPAAVFTIAKTGKQFKCPLTDECIKKMWDIYIYIQRTISHKKWNTGICSSMDRPRDYHTKKEKDKYYLLTGITYIWTLKYKWTYFQNRNRLTDIEKTYGTSLVIQCWRVCLLMQGTQIRSLVQENPTCQGAAEPLNHNYWAHVPLGS